MILAIFAGWISTLFGYNLDDHVIFDLRFVPLIISTLAYPRPITLILIGIGTGLTRLTFGVTEAAVAGMLNLLFWELFARRLATGSDAQPSVL